jgi:hypothetical protein
MVTPPAGVNPGNAGQWVGRFARLWRQRLVPQTELASARCIPEVRVVNV